ncbi:MAG: hypothetical protein NTV86_06715 [Planctomycetota bacterium]|nr:hypothetical protein [Planctomycetota bacterium]
MNRRLLLCLGAIWFAGAAAFAQDTAPAKPPPPDALKAKADALARMEKTKGADPAVLAEACDRLIDEAVAADRYDVARQGADLAVALAKKMGDRDWVQAAAARQQEVKALEAGYDQAQKALAILASDANNTSAYLAVGRFACFLKGDWDKGLPLLASSGEPALKALAEEEIAKPADPARQAALADGWWDLAQKEPPLPQRAIRLHAADGYRKALPGLTGVMKLKAQTRLEAVQEILDAAANRGRTHVVDCTSPRALQSFWTNDAKAWRVTNEGIVGQGQVSLYKPLLTFNKYFSEISQVTIRGRIVPPAGTNFRFSVGGINAILNWESGSGNRYTNAGAVTVQPERALTPGQWHTIVIEQKGPVATVSVDGKEIHRTTAQLAGTVTVYPMMSTIEVGSLKIIGRVDARRAVQGPSHANTD